MRILVVQCNPIIGDMANNTKKMVQSILSAKQKGADVVLFPELALSGYPPEDLLLHSAFIEAQESCLQQLVLASQGMFIVVGLARGNNGSKSEKPLFNSAAVIHDGAIIGFADKQLLPTYDIFDERRYFEPGSQTKIWNYQNKKIAVLICEDIWQHADYSYVNYTQYARCPLADLEKERVDILFTLAASPYAYQKLHMRLEIGAKSCKRLQCPMIMCCQMGGNDQLVFDGYSFYLDAQGELIEIAKGFEEEEMLIDFPSYQKTSLFIPDDWADLYGALVLGVRDYMGKLGFKKACLGVSGGIDSALVASIAVDALGRESVLAVNMPSRYSVQASITDAQQLAENLGIEMLQIPIEMLFKTTLDCLHPFFEARVEDITEENIQARIRGMILMALSNKLGYLVLSTANKSEMAMGYSTLYGDMVGSLSVICDVTKRQVYALADWINRHRQIIPHACIIKAPSAELKENQKDSDSLPDYEIIDNVLQGYVEELLSAEEIASNYGLALELVQDLIQRIHRAEYKRGQAPPGIRVSKRAFRVGRRYPIVQKWA